MLLVLQKMVKNSIVVPGVFRIQSKAPGLVYGFTVVLYLVLSLHTVCILSLLCVLDLINEL